MSKVFEELAKMPIDKLVSIANKYNVISLEQQIFLLSIMAELNRRNWFNKNLLMRSAPTVYSENLFVSCQKLGLKCTIENKIMEVSK